MDWHGCPESTDVEGRRGNGSGDGKMPGVTGIIALLVDAYYGVDLSGLVGMADLGTGTARQGSLTQEEEKELAKMSKVVLVGTEATWRSYFSEKLGKAYTPARMVSYTGGTHTPCGADQTVMEPLYCPGDRNVHLDLLFYDNIRKKLGVSGGTTFAYVIVHEVSHHVQNLLGILPEVDKIRQGIGQTQANAFSVRLELQADCFAGARGHYAANKRMLKAEDIQQVMATAKSAGNDRLQQNAQGYVMPDGSARGSSAGRVAWPKRGLESSDIGWYDTFTTN